MKKVAVIVGSLKKNSLNRLTAKAAIELAPDSLSFEFLEIGQLQLYNQDLDATPTADWVAFREALKTYDAVLFFTPEYNRSFPGVLKNALDVASRPWGASVWGGKPGGIISVSPGNLGGFGANYHLRQVLSYLDMPIMPQPEAFIGSAHTLFDAIGKLTDESTQKFLTIYMAAFATWIEKIS